MSLTRRTSKTANKDEGHTQHQRERINNDTITESIPQTGKKASNSPKGRNNTITKSKIIHIQSIEVILILITPILFTISTLHNGFGSLFSFLIQLGRFISQSSFQQLIDTRYIRLQQGNIAINRSQKIDHSISINTNLFSYSKQLSKNGIDILDIAIYLSYMGKDIRDSIINSSDTSISPTHKITNHKTHNFHSTRNRLILTTPIFTPQAKTSNSIRASRIPSRSIKVNTITIT